MLRTRRLRRPNASGSIDRGEQGIALLAAVFALVLVGGIVAGSVFVALQDQRIGRNMVRQQQAFGAAETAVLEPAVSWVPAGYADLPVGAAVTGAGTTTTGWFQHRLQRLSPMLYLSQAEGLSWDLASRQRVAVLLRLRPLPLEPDAALRTPTPPKLGPSSEVSGTDVQPAGWRTCPATRPTLPAVRIPGGLGTSGCQGENCLFGNLPFDSLRAYATKVVQPGGGTRVVQPSRRGPSCDTADPFNWGDPRDPRGPCGNYFPAVWVESDLILDGLRGQGVLMVNGDLTLGGGFAFFGLVLVRGTLRTVAAGARLTGGVIAGAVSLDQRGIVGKSLIQFSSCAVSRALTGSAVLVPLRERGWVGMY